jgi:2-amino-4-hydroxy-6-hydroxymethyldihydropteridine diphosphokinase
MDRVGVAIALGSNLGDRESHLLFGRSRLSSLLTDIRFSTVHETAPEGVPGPQDAFLNQAAVGVSGESPRALLGHLLAIEGERGRARPFPLAPRTLDLDLILFGDRIVTANGLHVPHPRFRARRFVLAPLAEIAPSMVDPVTGRSIRELLDQLPEPR